MWIWILLIGITIPLALVSYRVIKRPFWAALVAAVVATIGFQVVVRLQLGYADKLWPVAAAISFISTLVVALVVVFSGRYLANLKGGAR